MYKVIVKADTTTEQTFETFQAAKKYLESEYEEWAEYFCPERISDIYYKFWHRCTQGGYGSRKYMYAGCIYLKKVAA